MRPLARTTCLAGLIMLAALVVACGRTELVLQIQSASSDRVCVVVVSGGSGERCGVAREAAVGDVTVSGKPADWYEPRIGRCVSAAMIPEAGSWAKVADEVECPVGATTPRATGASTRIPNNG